MDYGDNGLRKSLYGVKANIKPEGTQPDLKMRIRYDFESTTVPQPGAVNVGSLAATLFIWFCKIWNWSLWCSNTTK